MGQQRNRVRDTPVRIWSQSDRILLEKRPTEKRRLNGFSPGILSSGIGRSVFSPIGTPWIGVHGRKKQMAWSTKWK